jgi:hypothetical protein
MHAHSCSRHCVDSSSVIQTQLKTTQPVAWINVG